MNMHFIRERIGRMLSYLEQQIYLESTPIDGVRFSELSEADISDAAPDPSGWEPYDGREIHSGVPGSNSGGKRRYFGFAFTAAVQERFDGKCVVLRVQTAYGRQWDASNPQLRVFVDGVLRQGFDENHREIVLSECAHAGEAYSVILTAYTGVADFSMMLEPQLSVLDRQSEKYYYDLKVPYETARLLDAQSQEYIETIQAINDSLNLLDMREEGSEAYRESLSKADDWFVRNFYLKYCDRGKKPVVYCIGHTHIDVAWLWPLSMTRDKAVRSFATVLELMKRYPEYKFMSSSPQLYQYVKELAPSVYKGIKQRVAEGRWEPEGAMWLEADCNISSGEALSRQILYGKRFFRREFGKDSEILWLPDVFGYSAALPQIMKLTGVRYFMTTKISWNETNMVPYDTFEWEGIDGTRRLTHFIPTRDYKKAAVEGGFETEHFTTYNGFLSPIQMKGAWARYNNKDLNEEVLCSFGYGDGGGGPTEEMLENERRMAEGIPGLPRTQMATAGEFFHTLEKNVTGSKYLPVWKGELYLEYHRGTYTTMARNKKYNRKSELALENEETFAVLDGLCTGETYPKQKLDAEWIVLMRNQFHDILPGSSIYEVYEESKQEYEKLLAENRTLQEKSLADVAEGVRAAAGSLVVFNPNSGTVPSVVTFRAPEGRKVRSVLDGGREQCVQETEEGYIFCAKDVPSKGYKTFEVRYAEEGAAETEGAVSAEEGGRLRASASEMENRWFRISFNEKMQFENIYDKRAGRYLFPEGVPGNVIMSYEDRPHNYDAWDINNYYTEKSWEVDDVTDARVVENGPVRATVRIERHYLESVLVQYISIYADIDRIDIRNEIDWKQHLIMLKDHFPVDVHANEATFDIQYGNVVRNTTDNTSWDWSKFEVCHHKWLDVAEDDFGLSVLNDCKYGVSVRGTDIGLTMLKSSLEPNPMADKEHHTFTYSLYPHTGTWKSAGTAKRAYDLNNPLQAVLKEKDGGTLPQERSLVRVFAVGANACAAEDAGGEDRATDKAAGEKAGLRDAENICIESVKKAEDSDAVIVRMYEYFNRRTKAVLRTGFPLKSASVCNIMEEDDTPAEVNGDEVFFEMRPCEIKTLKLEF